MCSNAALRDLVDGIRAQPARAMLAIVAVGVGASMASLLTIVLVSLEHASQRLVSELGANTVVVLGDSDSDEPGDRDQPEVGRGSGRLRNESMRAAKRGGGRLSQRHARLLRSNLPGLVASTVRQSSARTLGSNRPLRVIGTDQYLARVRGWRMVDGRFLDQREVEHGLRHLVLSLRLAEEWRWLVGEVVMLSDVPFVVVGIVAVRGDGLAGQLGNSDLSLGERLVFVPHSVPPLWDAAAASSARDGVVDALYLAVASSSDFLEVDHALRSARNLLAAPDVLAGSLSWITPELLVAKIRRLELLLGGTIAVVSLLCLVLGGTTLMSIMVSNIRDRIVEIGLRKTLGATPSQLTVQFLVESLVLTIAGGVAGVALAQVTIPLVAWALPMPLDVDPSSWLFPIGICAVLGVVFTLGPASRAARIEPASALRTE